MKKTSRLFLLAALALVLLTAACAGQGEGSPTASGTNVPEGQTASPAPVETLIVGATETPSVITATP